MPEIDATVVTRILDAGGTIVGKAHCEYFCLSGGSHTNATGPVHNPHKMGYSAGGSSSGSAVLVALGEADMAIGGDQGGSIRMPASFCGIYGMKPTHGLVPYTGIMPIEIYVDHTGPMTANVKDNALLLEVIAGPDGYDPRQYAPKVHPYTEALGGGVERPQDRRGEGGLRPAQLRARRRRQGARRRPSCSASSARRSRRSRSRGTSPAGALWLPIGVEGLTQTMMWGDGYGVSRPDLYVTSLMDFHRGWRNARQRDVRDHQALHDARHLHPPASRQPLLRQGDEHTRRLTAAYDAVLGEHDLLMMPTTPMKAQPMPKPDAPARRCRAGARDDHQHRALRHPHHPAMAVPCGMTDGLPCR